MKETEYKALARKHRPQTFKDVIHQTHIVKILQNSITSGNIHHSYIFSGMRGVGKTSVARIFAKALNCAEGPTTEPCNRCNNCQEITNGNFPDFLEIDGASNRGIEQVRELRESIKYKPLKGKYKVIIIDEVHMLTKEAFNALLKTLEEPPPHTVFILATTEFHKVIPTVVSRSISLDFRRIPFSIINKRLKKIVEVENITISDWALKRIAEVSEGSMRDSLSILEQLASYNNQNRIEDSSINTILGIINEEILEKTLNAVLSKDKKNILEIVKEIYNSGEDYFHFYKQFFNYIRDFLYYVETKNTDDRFSEKQINQFKKLSSRVKTLTILRLINILEKYEYSLRKTLNKRYLLEVIFLNLIYAQEAISIENLINKNVGHNKNPDTGKKDIKKNIKAVSKSKDFKVKNNLLNKLKERVKQKNEYLYYSLKDICNFKEENDFLQINISANKKSSLDLLEKEKDTLREIVNKVTGKNYDIKIKLDKNHIKKSSTEKLKQDKNIKQFLNLFKGKIIDIK